MIWVEGASTIMYFKIFLVVKSIFQVAYDTILQLNKRCRIFYVVENLAAQKFSYWNLVNMSLMCCKSITNEIVGTVLTTNLYFF